MRLLAFVKRFQNYFFDFWKPSCFFHFLFCLTYVLFFPSTGIFAESNPIVLQLKWKHQFQFAGYYAALEKGYYKDAGLDVRIVEALPGVDPVEEVLSGRAQFGVGTSELVLRRYQGAPVKVLEVIFQHSPLGMISLQKSGIDNIHKLSGKQVMVEHSSAELFAYFKQEGFSEKDFNIQDHSFDLNDLLSGKTDAMSVYLTDELFVIQQKKLAINQFTPRAGGIDFYGDNLFTIEKELKDRPQMVEAFRESSMKGWRYAMENPEEIVEIIYSRYSKRHSKEHLLYEASAMHGLMQPNLIDPGYMNSGRWQHISETYHKLGLLPDHYDVIPLLHLPDLATDLKNLKRILSFSAIGMSIFVLIIVVLYRFYRSARISEARIKIIIDNAPVSIIILNEENRVQRWNTEAEKTFHWTSAEMMGKEFSVFVPKEEITTVETILNEVHKNFKVSHHQNWNLRKDGSLILCEWLNAPFRDDFSDSGFIICMARDITEQKRSERELKESATRLSELISIKDKFFSIIAHDLKGPVGNYHNLVKLMLEEDQDYTEKERSKFLKLLEESSANIYSVRDSGIGMNSTLIKNLFRLDHKQSHLGTAGETGTGLGMILIKEFVERHKGEIWVESEERKGTTVFFSVP